MAVKITSRKPLSANDRSHALNTTKRQLGLFFSDNILLYKKR